MKYIRKFNEVKIFGRKMDRNKFTSIEDLNLMQNINFQY